MRQLNKFIRGEGFTSFRASLAALAVLILLITCNADRTSSEESEGPEASPLPVIAIMPPPDYDATVYDTVIINARLINPETNSDLDCVNIGIKGGSIAAVTRRPLYGAKEVDAAGLIAAPGFIDTLSFELGDTSERFKISDGVTTNLVMHGGTANARLWYAIRAERPYIVNYGASSFITVMRQQLGYYDTNVIVNPDHINTLANNVRRNISEGALGISMSPEYTPGVQGDEMLALSRLAAEMDVTTFYHLRYSTPYGENSSLRGIQEVLDLARVTGAATHIMHITSTGATHVAKEAFAMVDSAISEGMDITACVYPYDFWASNISMARFNPGWQERFKLTYNDLQIANTATRLTAETFAEIRGQSYIIFARNSIPEEEIRFALKQPYVYVASDDIMTGHSHPRGAGNFSRTIGRYARDEGVISLMEAIAKMTIMPARRLESASDDIKRKGRLEIGADADIVLFDYEKIIDTATPDNPFSYSEGIRYVWVNGRLGVDSGRILTVRAGQPVMSRYASPAKPPEFTNYSLYLKNAQENVFLGVIPAFELYGLHFTDLRAAAEILKINFMLAENGDITFGQARMILGDTFFTSYEQESHLHHEPVIFRGSVYLPVIDLPYLIYGLEYKTDG